MNTKKDMEKAENARLASQLESLEEDSELLKGLEEISKIEKNEQE